MLRPPCSASGLWKAHFQPPGSLPVAGGSSPGTSSRVAVRLLLQDSSQQCLPPCILAALRVVPMLLALWVYLYPAPQLGKQTIFLLAFPWSRSAHLVVYRKQWVIKQKQLNIHHDCILSDGTPLNYLGTVFYKLASLLRVMLNTMQILLTPRRNIATSISQQCNLNQIAFFKAHDENSINDVQVLFCVNLIKRSRMYEMGSEAFPGYGNNIYW